MAIGPTEPTPAQEPSCGCHHLEVARAVAPNHADRHLAPCPGDEDTHLRALQRQVVQRQIVEEGWQVGGVKPYGAGSRVKAEPKAGFGTQMPSEGIHPSNADWHGFGKAAGAASL